MRPVASVFRCGCVSPCWRTPRLLHPLSRWFAGGVDSLCSSAYTDHLCLKCAPDHYRLDEQCKSCPDLAILFIVVFCVVGLLFMLLLDAASKRRINLSAVGIGVDFCQVLCRRVRFVHVVA